MAEEGSESERDGGDVSVGHLRSRCGKVIVRKDGDSPAKRNEGVRGSERSQQGRGESRAE